MGDKSDLRHRDVSNGKVENGMADTNPMPMKDAESLDDDTGACSRFHAGLVGLCSPCLVRTHPLPENPTPLQRLLHAFRIPPHGSLASYARFGIVCLQIWVILYCLTHGQALPGGNFFSLLILFVCCVAGGYLISFVKLPPLLGMLIVGVCLRNIPVVNIVGDSIETRWSSVLKNVALTVILTRAGLGLDVVKLKKLSWAVLRLAFTPCLVEIVTGAVVSRFLLGFPWTWSWMLGCILGALSPAVTVPILVNLQDRRYGIAKGIPTMLLAAGGLDNVFCITGFSVFLGIIFSEGDLAVTIIKGPLGAVAGVAYGFIMGIILWYIPSKDSANPVFYRSLMLFLSGMIAIFGSTEVKLAGAGPLGCLTTATVANYKWRQRRKQGEPDEVSAVFGLAWLIVQHFLFGLIGSAVKISNIKSSTAGLGIATLGIGLVVRSIASFTVTLGTGFNMKERIFIVMTWLAKATVQAAIGGIALDRVKLSDTVDEEQLRLATDVLTIAVLAIIICAPIGATLMTVFGPRFLVHGEEDEVQLQVVSHDEKSSTKREDNEKRELELSNRAGSHTTMSIMPITTKESKALALEDVQPTIGIINPCFEEEHAVSEVNNETPKYTIDFTDDSSVKGPDTMQDHVNERILGVTNDIDLIAGKDTEEELAADEPFGVLGDIHLATAKNTDISLAEEETFGVTGDIDLDIDQGTDIDLAAETGVKEIYKTVVEVRAPSVSNNALDDIDNNNTGVSLM